MNDNDVIEDDRYSSYQDVTSQLKFTSFIDYVIGKITFQPDVKVFILHFN